jgi:hypothetical protein
VKIRFLKKPKATRLVEETRRLRYPFQNRPSPAFAVKPRKMGIGRLELEDSIQYWGAALAGA